MSQARLHDTILSTLKSELNPQHLEVIDESAGHSRRTESNPETHFKVIVVSEAFSGLSRVRRQQLVYSLLSQLFKNGLHSLSQLTFTPDEWSKNPKVESSPVCSSRAHKAT